MQLHVLLMFPLVYLVSRVADGSKAKGINSNGSAAASERYVIWNGRIPDFCTRNSKKCTPFHFVLCLQSKTNANRIPKKICYKMVIDMTLKVHNSICIAVIHTYITYHIIQVCIYICMLVGIAIGICPYVYENAYVSLCTYQCVHMLIRKSWVIKLITPDQPD